MDSIKHTDGVSQMEKFILFLLFTTYLLFPRPRRAFAKTNTVLPNIYIVATGGTIAGCADSAAETADYKPAALSINELLKTVTEFKNYANIKSEQFAQWDSTNISTKNLLVLGKHINKLIFDDSVNGIVITHGTDTMEETAYFLNLTIKSRKPVILVGSMRPASALSADGPLNLYNAVLIAASKETLGKGVLVTMNDGIYAARDVRKTSTYKASAFVGTEYGCIGTVQNGSVRYYYDSIKKHTSKSCFNIGDLKDLPPVEIIYEYLGGSSTLLSHIASKCDGIVFAGNGNGNLNDDTESFIKSTKSLPVLVRSSKTMSGAVEQIEKYKNLNILTADDLTPQKARILLMLALTKTTVLSEIQDFFNEY